jgi:hypothetical protein
MPPFIGYVAPTRLFCGVSLISTSQFASSEHVAEQQSPLTALPSSHCSADPLMASPQTVGLHTLFEQLPLAQSSPFTQARPPPQEGHAAPPQSTSVSAPFFTASEHVGAWQVPPEQTPLTQSVGTEHAFRIAQSKHDPPQSTSDSVPFLTLSLHAASWQMPLKHTLFRQSTAPVHL